MNEYQQVMRLARRRELWTKFWIVLFCMTGAAACAYQIWKGWGV